MAKKYKSMRTAANALKRKGVNLCSDYFSLKNSDVDKVIEVMDDSATFRPNKNSGKSLSRDFYDRMSKYGSCR